MTLSFDWIAICTVGRDRAMLKHYTNFLQYPDEQEMRAAATERVDVDDGDDSGDEAA